MFPKANQSVLLLTENEKYGAYIDVNTEYKIKFTPSSFLKLMTEGKNTLVCPLINLNLLRSQWRPETKFIDQTSSFLWHRCDVNAGSTPRYLLFITGLSGWPFTLFQSHSLALSLNRQRIVPSGEMHANNVNFDQDENNINFASSHHSRCSLGFFFAKLRIRYVVAYTKSNSKNSIWRQHTVCEQFGIFHIFEVHA